MGIQIKLVYADPSFETQTFPYSSTSGSGCQCTTLSIFIRSPQAFVSLFISPTPRLALALGQESERQLTISDSGLFGAVFDVQQKTPGTIIRVGILAQYIRHYFLPETLMPSSWENIPHVHFLSVPFISESRIVRTTQEGRNVLALFLFYILLYVEKFVFTSLHARFVVGDEPWNIWSRVAQTVGSTEL